MHSGECLKDFIKFFRSTIQCPSFKHPKAVEDGLTDVSEIFKDEKNPASVGPTD